MKKHSVNHFRLHLKTLCCEHLSRRLSPSRRYPFEASFPFCSSFFSSFFFSFHFSFSFCLLLFSIVFLFSLLFFFSFFPFFFFRCCPIRCASKKQCDYFLTIWIISITSTREVDHVLGFLGGWGVCKSATQRARRTPP